LRGTVPRVLEFWGKTLDFSQLVFPLLLLHIQSEALGTILAWGYLSFHVLFVSVLLLLTLRVWRRMSQFFPVFSVAA